MSTLWESPVLGSVPVDVRALGAMEALELCRSWTEDRIDAR